MNGSIFKNLPICAKLAQILTNDVIFIQKWKVKILGNLSVLGQNLTKNWGRLLMYEWVIFSRKFGMAGTFKFSVVRPYPNKISVPPGLKGSIYFLNIQM